MTEEFLWPGEWLTELLMPIFKWLAEEHTAPSLAMWMLYAALAFWLIYVAWVTMICKMLKYGRRLVAKQSEATLAQTLPRINQQMEQRFQRFFFVPGLARSIWHTWKEFDETLIKPEPDDPHSIVWNTVRPQTFFNQVAIGPRFRLFSALPGIFVGLGLLLTFFGLVSALFFATQGIGDGGSLAETQDALKDLLRAASFKFYTSIAGLAASLWFVLSLRIGARFIDGSFDKLSNALESCLRFATPEDKIFQLTRLGERQLEQLEKLNTDIGVAIGKRVEEALNNTLPAHLATPLQQLSERLEHVAGNLSNINVDALQKMGQAFSRELLGATQGQFQELAKVLGDLKTSLGGMKKNMDESGSELAENVRVSATEMQAAIASATEAANQMASNLEAGAKQSNQAMETQVSALKEQLSLVSEELAGQLSKIGSAITERVGSAGENAVALIGKAADALRESLESASEEFSQTERQIAAHREAIREIGSATANVGDAAERATASFQAAAVPLQSVAQDIASTAQETRATLTEAVSAMQKVTHDLQQTGGNLAKAAESSEEASLRFREVDVSLGKILEDLVGRTNDATTHIQNYVVELDRLFSQSIDRLAGGIETLGEMVEGLEESTRNRKRGQKKESREEETANLKNLETSEQSPPTST